VVLVDIDFGQLALIVVVGLLAVSALQFLLRMMGRLFRWLASIAVVALVLYLLWQMGVIDWVTTATESA
jgi:hypothetical protein